MEFYKYKMFSIDEEKKAKRFAYRHHGIVHYCQFTEDGENIKFGYEVKYCPPVNNNYFIYFCTEYRNLHTLASLKKLYNEEVNKEHYPTLNDWLKACHYINNGTLARVINLSRDELIKIIKREYKINRPWEADADTDKMTTWRALRKLTRAELYDIIYSWHEDAFKKLER